MITKTIIYHKLQFIVLNLISVYVQKLNPCLDFSLTKHDQSLSILSPEINIDLLGIESEQLIAQANMSLEEGSPERRELPVAQNVDVGASVQKHLDTVVPAVGARVVEHRVAARVAGVRVGAKAQQVAEGSRVAAHGRVDCGGALEAVARLYFGVVLDQQLDYLLVA